MNKAEQLELGLQLRDAGMARAVDHAESVSEGWSDRAYALFVQFAARRKPFRTEQAREYATELGLPPAPHARAWGAIASRARKAGVIRFAGFDVCENPKAHRCPVKQWVAS